MPESIRLSALQFPLRHVSAFELRKPGVIALCTPLDGLPSGWTGIADRNGPIMWRRVNRGPAVSLAETATLNWSILNPGNSATTATSIVTTGGAFRRTSREGELPSGDFQCVNHLGVVRLLVQKGGDEQELLFDVVSTKFSGEQDFQWLTEDIARHCQQLLLEWGTPSGIPFSVDPERRNRLLLEQFLFLKTALSNGSLERWFEILRNTPHNTLKSERSWREADRVRSSDFLSNPSARVRDWRRRDGRLHPGEILDVTKHEHRNTPPNQFVLHMLKDFDGLCREVSARFTPPGGPASGEAVSLSSRIKSLIGSPFFRGITPPTRLPLDSPVLHKRQGYRDFLRVWLLLERASRLEWNGRSDVFSGTVRNVATLYEYWLFFEMLAVLRSIPSIRELRFPVEAGEALPAFCKQEGRLKINLRRGEASLVQLQHVDESGTPIRIHFWFDRSFYPTHDGDVLAAGAYSRPFRPDFSLAVFPAEFAHGAGPLEAERRAEEQGNIVHLHFDAKYRVDQHAEIFGEPTESVLSEEEEGKTTNTYRRADLYKMHAYNDAIRRTVGSYVLYPGAEPTSRHFGKYHEVLPGVGAFAIAPGNAERKERLREFLSDVLARQSDRYTQLARVNYWTHNSVKETPQEYRAIANDLVERPPADTDVLLGFLRSGESQEEYMTRRVFYCHAIEWGESAQVSPGLATKLEFDPFRAEFLVLFQNKHTLPWIAKIQEVRIVTAEERADELRRTVSTMRAAYYFRFAFDSPAEMIARQVSTLVKHRPGRPVAVTLGELAACKPA